MMKKWRNKKKTNNKEKGKEIERRDTSKTRHVLEDNCSTDNKDDIPNLCRRGQESSSEEDLEDEEKVAKNKKKKKTKRKKKKKKLERKKVTTKSHTILAKVVVGWNKKGRLKSNLSKP
eukprot:2979504-Ditylum_brightwellii.AAC.1